MVIGKRFPWKQETNLAEDIFVLDPHTYDLVIPVVGPTGVGKSTFINTLFEESIAIVGHDLASETQQIQYYIYPDPDRRIIIVDTPGFNDTNVDDREILRRVAIWLAGSYNADMKLAGILYMHDISSRRMTGSQIKRFDMFRKLCGEDAMGIMLVTSSWDDVSEESGRQREDQLRKVHWKDLVMRGSPIRRFDGTPSSAQSIIKDLLAQKAANAEQPIIGSEKKIPSILRQIKELSQASFIKMIGLFGVYWAGPTLLKEGGSASYLVSGVMEGAEGHVSLVLL